MTNNNNDNPPIEPSDNADVSIDTIYQVAVEYERESIKTALIINAGSAIALLALSGAFANTQFSYVVGQLAYVMLINATGIILAGLAYVNSAACHSIRYNNTHYVNVQKSFLFRKTPEIINDPKMTENRNNEKNMMAKNDKLRGLSYLCFILGCIVSFFIVVCNF